MLIYSGCELEHWREDLLKVKTVDKYFYIIIMLKSKTAKENKFDKRPMLGLPSYFKGFTVPKK